MDFQLSEEQEVLQKTVRDFCNKNIVPFAAQWDAEERFPADVVASMGEMGLMGMCVDEAYGGAGMSVMDYVVALEEVARADGSVGLTMASHNSLCTGHIVQAGNEAQKKNYVSRLATGKFLGAWGLTEPGSGSDAGAARTRAEKQIDADGNVKWLINGSKTFITQGSVASFYVILASTSPEKKQRGLTAFVLEKGMAGFRTGRHIEKMGLRASDTTELIFEDVLVEDAQRLGEVDRGFYDTLAILDKGRIGIGAWATGIGVAALEAAKAYAKDRVQFGQSISTFQGIQHMIADATTELEAARLLVWRAAWMLDNGMHCNREASVAKYFASGAAMRACNAAIQIHGGYGYTREFPVERYFRDAKLGEIGEGTNEVQKMVIARALLQDLG